MTINYLDLLIGSVSGLFDQYNTSEPEIVIPEVDRRNATFEVHFSVLLESGISLDLEFSKAIGGLNTLVERRLVLVRPWRSVRVAVSIVIAQEVVLADVLVARHFERLIDGTKQIFAQVRHQVDQAREILLDLLRRQPTHQVEREVQLLVVACLRR